MKKQKTQSGRAVLKQLQNTKLAVPKKRKLHVHIALHPMSILLVLCMGVLLVSFTLNAVADSYLVTAIVPAAPLTEPAKLLSPPDGTITGTQGIVAGGTCPADSYVDLFDNGHFVGAAICSASGTFGIGVTMVQGTNQLRAQDYNITNDPGPVSSPITITYVPGAPQLPDGKFSLGAVVVGQLVVTQVDTNIAYQPDTKLQISSHPAFAGVAPPLADITVAVNASQACVTTASVQGYWTCTVAGVATGTHAVDVSADSPGGAHLTFPTFNVTVPNPPLPPATFVAPPIPPLQVSSSYSYSVHNVGQPVSYTIGISGGRGPYAVMVSWGDGNSQLLLRMGEGTFSVSHTYGWIDSKKSIKTMHIQVIDTAGQSATLQFDSVIRNPAIHSAIANITKSTGLWGLFERLRPWLWLLWPGYIVVVLLIFSFWLGEHQEMMFVRQKRRLAALKGRSTPAHNRRHAHR